MPKGILWVSSRICRPDHLAPEKFCDWYENRHIQEVLSLSGVPCAARYEALPAQAQECTLSAVAPWLTLYAMPDIAYRDTREFKSLDGQAPPDKELLEGIFHSARFDTRFYREIEEGMSRASEDQRQRQDGPKGGPAKWLASISMKPLSGATEEEFKNWYTGEYTPLLARIPGFVRTRGYVLEQATILERFERRVPEVSRFLVLLEFDGGDGEGEVPWKEVVECGRTGREKFAMEEEVGVFALKREYTEEEWGDVGK